MNGKTLTLETVMLRTKNDKLQTLLKLNLWGNDLEDVSCLNNIPNLEVVSLAVNKIKTLKPFSKLTNLKELYLRGNRIASFAEVNFLKNCKQLKTLTLNENPLCDNSNYRKKIIQMLPSLLKLDEKVISNEEKAQAERGDDDDDEFNVSDDANILSMDIEDNKSIEENKINQANKKTSSIGEVKPKPIEDSKSKDGSKGGEVPTPTVQKNFANLNKRVSNLQNSKDNSGIASGSDDYKSKKSSCNRNPNNINNQPTNNNLSKPPIKKKESDYIKDYKDYDNNFSGGNYENYEDVESQAKNKDNISKNKNSSKYGNYNDNSDDEGYNQYLDYKKSKSNIINVNEKNIMNKMNNYDYGNNNYQAKENKDDYRGKNNQSKQNRPIWMDKQSNNNDYEYEQPTKIKSMIPQNSTPLQHNGNIVRSITLLLNELNFQDLYYIKERVDMKLFNLGNNFNKANDLRGGDPRGGVNNKIINMQDEGDTGYDMNDKNNMNVNKNSRYISRQKYNDEDYYDNV